jgi:hypothetical protein
MSKLFSPKDKDTLFDHTGNPVGPFFSDFSPEPVIEISFSFHLIITESSIYFHEITVISGCGSFVLSSSYIGLMNSRMVMISGFSIGPAFLAFEIQSFPRKNTLSTLFHAKEETSILTCIGYHLVSVI